MTKKNSEDIGAAIRKVSALARLLPDGEKLARMTSAAASVIEYVKQLNELDTKDVPPMSHAMDARLPLRMDEVKVSDASALILDAAPQRDGCFVQVPKVVDTE